MVRRGESKRVCCSAEAGAVSSNNNRCDVDNLYNRERNEGKPSSTEPCIHQEPREEEGRKSDEIPLKHSRAMEGELNIDLRNVGNLTLHPKVTVVIRYLT